MIMRNVNRDIIKRNVDEWTAQSPHATKEQIFQQVCNELDSGSSFALQYENFIMVTKPINNWVGEVHIFSENKKSSVIAFKSITQYIFENTPAIKLYGKFSNKKILSLILKSNWKHEGTLEKTFVCMNGELKDLYIAGVSKEDFIKCLILD